MCKISGEIKFCSCHGQSIQELDNYWVFYRYLETKYEFVFGQSLLPNPFIDKIEFENKPFLLQRINEPDAFDVPLLPHEKDRLKLVFSKGRDRLLQLTCTFEFTNGSWTEIAYDEMNWKAQHDEIDLGKIQSPFVNTRKE